MNGQCELKLSPVTTGERVEGKFISRWKKFNF